MVFRFEEVWIGEERYDHIIEQNWQSGGRGEIIQDVMDVISRCNQSLGQWNKNRFGNIQKNLAKVKRAQSMDQRMASSEVIREA